MCQETDKNIMMLKLNINVKQEQLDKKNNDLIKNEKNNH